MDYSHQERYKHRKHRHHLEGAYKAGKVFGKMGRIVAFIHIADDNEGDVPLMTAYDIPEYK